MPVRQCRQQPWDAQIAPLTRTILIASSTKTCVMMPPSTVACRNMHSVPVPPPVFRFTRQGQRMPLAISKPPSRHLLEPTPRYSCPSQSHALLRRRQPRHAPGHRSTRSSYRAGNFEGHNLRRVVTQDWGPEPWDGRRDRISMEGFLGLMMEALLRLLDGNTGTQDEFWT
jgi:hypothetical protein